MIRLAYGLPGTGKSTLLHDLVKSEAHVQRFFIVDNEWQWGPDGIHWRGSPPPMQVFYENSEIPKELPPTGVLVFRNWDPLEVARLVVKFGHSVYVNDEIDRVARKQNWEENPLRAIVHEGRHLKNELGEYTVCHLMGACRRPQNLHTDLSEIADEIFVFRLQGKNTFGRLIGDNTIEDDQVQYVRDLPDLRCFHHPSGQELELFPVGTPMAR